MMQNWFDKLLETLSTYPWWPWKSNRRWKKYKHRSRSRYRSGSTEEV